MTKVRMAGVSPGLVRRRDARARRRGADRGLRPDRAPRRRHQDHRSARRADHGHRRAACPRTASTRPTGKSSRLRDGRLLFAGGPIDQPGLDVEAVRRPAESILVGARVRGTLKPPELTVFSEPTMPQQEQLSYLILGRPLQSATDSESSAMSRAALALGLKGGNFVSERVNENLGLDEFGIQTDPGESSAQASFVIGKYLIAELVCELRDRVVRAREYAQAQATRSRGAGSS